MWVFSDHALRKIHSFMWKLLLFDETHVVRFSNLHRAYTDCILNNAFFFECLANFCSISSRVNALIIFPFYYELYEIKQLAHCINGFFDLME